MRRSFADVLIERLQAAATQPAFSFTPERGVKSAVNYEQLLRRAVAIGESLAERSVRKGDRVLLLLPPGIDYIAAFVACLIKGFISVPAYPVKRNQKGQRIMSIIRSATPSAVLVEASDSEFERVADSAGDVPAPMFLSTVDAFPDAPLEGVIEKAVAALRPEDVAFLQYTSGSTGNPKGVMVTHGNLLHNSSQMQHKFRTSADSRMVTWLPPYHDMGLILGLLQPLFVGFPCDCMPPAAFMRNPLSWLELVSHTRGTISGAPNFAYQLCVQRASNKDLSGLDLSSWRTAFNGAEPIAPEVLREFVRVFRGFGLKPGTIHPCYGLAENTLMVTGQDGTDVDEDTALDRYIRRRRQASDERAGPEIVNCGTPIEGQDIVIVDPTSRSVCGEGFVGEIWVSGASVAQGYWNNPAETEATFRGTLDGSANSGAKQYLRTGDLGFIEDHALYVTGRIKDLIIIRGVKYYPQDIERAVEDAHPWIRRGGYCAAVACEEIQPESIGIAVEVVRQFRTSGTDELVRSVRASIANEFALRVSAVSVMQPGHFPKTSSGKIPRGMIKAMLVDQRMPVSCTA